MPVRTTYLPAADAKLLAFAQNFSTRTTAAPTTFGLTAAMCTSYAALVSAFATDLAACDPGVRSKASTLTKNQAKVNMIAETRRQVSLVGGTAGVTNAMRAQLGLTVRVEPQPIPAPNSSPKVSVVSVNGRTVRIKLENAEAIKRARPFGAQGCQVYSLVAQQPSTNPADYSFQGITTKPTIDVIFDNSVLPGATVWIVANWYTATALTGPVSQPVSAVIQYGMQVTPQGQQQPKAAA